jgi:hypothetical protein
MGCLWDIEDASGQIIQHNARNGGPGYVELRPGDVVFYDTSGCAAWVQADGNLDQRNTVTAFGQFPGMGEYRVGAEVPAGVYQNTDPNYCQWNRLANFRGNGIQSLASLQHGTTSVVTIQPSDAGFSTSCLGVWTKIG